MTKSRALANLSDCHDQTDMRQVNMLVHDCLLLGVKPWDIKQTLRGSLIPVSRLSAAQQERLNAA